MRISDWSSDVCSSDLPVTPGIGHADWLAVRSNDVGDDKDLRPLLVIVSVKHIAVERPKAAAEGELLLGRQTLISEDDRAVMVVGGFDLDRKSTRLNSSH